MCDSATQYANFYCSRFTTCVDEKDKQYVDVQIKLGDPCPNLVVGLKDGNSASLSYSLEKLNENLELVHGIGLKIKIERHKLTDPKFTLFESLFGVVQISVRVCNNRRLL
jgi:hypothetical protein